MFEALARTLSDPFLADGSSDFQTPGEGSSSTLAGRSPSARNRPRAARAQARALPTRIPTAASNVPIIPGAGFTSSATTVCTADAPALLLPPRLHQYRTDSNRIPSRKHRPPNIRAWPALPALCQAIRALEARAIARVTSPPAKATRAAARSAWGAEPG